MLLYRDAVGQAGDVEERRTRRTVTVIVVSCTTHAKPHVPAATRSRDTVT